MVRAIVLSLALLLVAVSATDMKQCKKGQPLPLSLDIQGCASQPCDVVKGTTAVMDVHFVANKEEITKLTAVVHATTLGITVPYELPEDVADVCKNLLNGASCPIYETEDVVYKFNFYIEPVYPEISVSVQVSLNDQDGDSVACFVANIKVRKGAVKPQRITLA